MALYHKDVGFPADAQMPQGGLRLLYSAHARYEARTEGLSVRDLPESLPDVFEVIELRTHGDLVDRWVVRFHSEKLFYYDFVLVVTPGGYVITVWLNHIDDRHHTLDRSKYVAPDLQ